MKLVAWQVLCFTRTNLSSSQKHFLYKADLPNVIMRMFNNTMYVAVISTIFFIFKYLRKLFLRYLLNKIGKFFRFSKSLIL